MTLFSMSAAAPRLVVFVLLSALLATGGNVHSQARLQMDGNTRDSGYAGDAESLIEAAAPPAAATQAAPHLQHIHPAPITREQHQARHGSVVMQADLDRFRRLAVFDDGRVKTIDTLAREHMIRIMGREQFRDVLAETESLLPGKQKRYKYDPVFTLLDLAFRVDRAHGHPHEGYYLDKPMVHVEVLPLRERLIAHLPAEAQERWKKLGRLSPELMRQPAPAAILKGQDGDIRTAGAKNKVIAAWHALIATEDRLLMVPPTNPEGEWTHPGAADAPPKVAEAWAQLRYAWLMSDEGSISLAMDKLAQALQTVSPEVYPSENRRSIEVLYNRSGRYAMGWVSFAIAAVLLIIAAMTLRPTLAAVGTVFLIVGLLAQIAGMVSRTVISGRWPIHNQYESYMAIALFAVIVGLVVMLWKKQWVFGAAASVVGAGALMFAHFLPAAFPTKAVANDMPILATSNILWIHVNIVLLSYGLIALAFAMSVIYLLVHYLGDAKPVAQAAAGVVAPQTGVLAGADAGTGSSPIDEASALPRGGRKKLLSDLDTAQLVVMQLAFWLLGVGIILGAYWADHAWGRWWAWDPKETWALLTWMIYLVAIHLRFAVRNRGLVTAWLGFAGFFVMLFCYWGVNLFLAGLHSYA